MKNHIPAIDGLRGIAILMVIYQHLFSTYVANHLDFHYILANGWMGVNLFFILSGFVLALPYFSDDRKLEVKEFYIHRAKRLLPLFIFMALVSYMINMEQGKHLFHSLLLTISTASMFTTTEFYPKINGPFWSLAVEIWFSVAFPFVMLQVAKNGLWKVFWSILAISLAIRIPGAYMEFINIHQNPIKDSVIARMDDFMVGIAIAYGYSKGSLPKFRFYLPGGLLVLLCSAFFWDLRVHSELPLYLVGFLNNLTQIGFAGILIYALTHESKLMNMGWLRMLGMMCFSIYCWHGILMTPALMADPTNFKRLTEYVILLMGLSALTYRYIEFPKKTLSTIFRFQTKPIA